MRVAADGRLLRELVVFAGCGLFVSRAGPKPHTPPNTLNLHLLASLIVEALLGCIVVLVLCLACVMLVPPSLAWPPACCVVDWCVACNGLCFEAPPCYAFALACLVAA